MFNPWFNFWNELPTALRAVMGLLLMAIAALIYFVSDGTIYAIGIGVLGLIFLLFCGAGNAKGGYKF